MFWRYQWSKGKQCWLRLTCKIVFKKNIPNGFYNCKYIKSNSTLLFCKIILEKLFCETIPNTLTLLFLYSHDKHWGVFCDIYNCFFFFKPFVFWSKHSSWLSWNLSWPPCEELLCSSGLVVGLFKKMSSTCFLSSCATFNTNSNAFSSPDAQDAISTNKGQALLYRSSITNFLIIHYIGLIYASNNLISCLYSPPLKNILITNLFLYLIHQKLLKHDNTKFQNSEISYNCIRHFGLKVEILPYALSFHLLGQLYTLMCLSKILMLFYNSY